MDKTLQTDIGGLNVNVDGKEIFVRNAGMDGIMPVHIIEDSDYNTDGMIDETLLEGDVIKVPGFDEPLSGKYLGYGYYVENSDSYDYGEVYIIKAK